jgi:sarcosine oxidase gamma subunit
MHQYGQPDLCQSGHDRREAQTIEARARKRVEARPKREMMAIETAPTRERPALRACLSGCRRYPGPTSTTGAVTEGSSDAVWVKPTFNSDMEVRKGSRAP